MGREGYRLLVAVLTAGIFILPLGSRAAEKGGMMEEHKEGMMEEKGGMEENKGKMKDEKNKMGKEKMKEQNKARPRRPKTK